MNTEIYKEEKFVDELNEQVWRKTVSFEFDLTKVPAVKKLQNDKFKELDQMKEYLKAIDPKDTTKATRTQRKALETKIAKAEEFIVSCDETISLINESIRKEKEKIKALKDRVEFAKTFTYNESRHADDN